jgi:aspartate aminotransferase
MTGFAPTTSRPAPAEGRSAGRLSRMAGQLVGSEILKIAADVRALREGGAAVRDFTVGDFDPAQFRIPAALAERIEAALRRGHTNYPPSSGVRVLREAVADDLERAIGVRYPFEQVLVTGGSRPGIYGTYRTLVDAGDRVVYPAPSWNNNHYCRLVGAVGVPVPCRPEDAFLPTRELLEPVVRGARLLALNSPLNPAGTSFTAEQLGAICDLVVEENERRAPNERPLYLLYDQVYRTITFDGVAHVDPVSLRPAIAPYTVYVDGVSKSLAATGIRVGWVAGPADVIGPMSNVLGHVGAWAPHAEQIAVAEFLADVPALLDHQRRFVAGVGARLRPLHAGVEAMRHEGLPVESVVPTGAIYLSVRFALNGHRAPGGEPLATNEDIRRYLLDAAGVAVVPFQAFGTTEESGWFRLSVGAVSVSDVEQTIPRLRTALGPLQA